MVVHREQVVEVATHLCRAGGVEGGRHLGARHVRQGRRQQARLQSPCHRYPALVLQGVLHRSRRAFSHLGRQGKVRAGVGDGGFQAQQAEDAQRPSARRQRHGDGRGDAERSETVGVRLVERRLRHEVARRRQQKRLSFGGDQGGHDATRLVDRVLRRLRQPGLGLRVAVDQGHAPRHTQLVGEVHDGQIGHPGHQLGQGAAQADGQL
ncbi:MAG TPA: hypothetical protein VK428_09235, partial [Acidimicrobiales bacterium]|nr:hypothetical protein [Acidimicrobiales bacterium]